MYVRIGYSLLIKVDGNVDDWIRLVGCRWEMILDSYLFDIYLLFEGES